jgi:hypothetical protein
MPDEWDYCEGGHAICIVGHDDKKKQFKFKNSWGKSWGKKGYGFLPYRYMGKYLMDAWSAKALGLTGPSYNFVEPDEDGVSKPWWYELRPPIDFKWPPDHLNLLEYIPAGVEPGHLYAETILNPQEYGMNYKAEAGLFIHANPVVELVGAIPLRVVVDPYGTRPGISSVRGFRMKRSKAPSPA